ncbi:MAG: hypothetical protein P8X42_15955 [Calditrichaceae bacterium]
MKSKNMEFKSSTIFTLIILLLIMPVINPSEIVYAQGSLCEKSLKKAEELYHEGQFDKAIDLITICLKNKEVTPAEEKQAYRLLGLTYLAQDYLKEAKASVKKLLELVPNYKPDPLNDPPPFVKIVEEVQSETPPPKPPSDENKKDTGSRKWWYIGGGVVVGAVLAAVFWPEGDEPEDLPGPPDLP